MAGGGAKAGRDLWGGHFGADTAPLMQQINASIGFDKRLWCHDIAGSAAHARMLAARGIITEASQFSRQMAPRKAWRRLNSCSSCLYGGADMLDT